MASTMKAMRILSLLVLLFTLAACAHSLEKKRSEAYTHYKLGVVYYDNGNIADALKELTKAVEIYPDDPSYHVALGLAYFARGLDEDAKKHLKKAIKLDPRFSEARVNLAAVYIKGKEWDNAIKECQEALGNIYYKTPEAAYLNMGWAYYNKGRYAEAIESYRKGLELKPDMAPLYYNLGLAYERTEKPEEAAEVYRKAVKYNEGYVDAYYRLGLVLLKTRERAGALKAFKKVIELAPDDERARSARDYIELLK